MVAAVVISAHDIRLWVRGQVDERKRSKSRSNPKFSSKFNQFEGLKENIRENEIREEYFPICCLSVHRVNVTGSL